MQINNRVGFVFLVCVAIGVGVSRMNGTQPHPDAIEYNEVDTSTSASFNLASVVIVLMLIALYATWW